MQNKKIMVAGHVALDISPTFPSNYKASLSDIAKPGNLVNVGKAEFTLGGCVSNAGLALHQFGADTMLVSKIGGDNFGKILMEKYRELGAEPQFVEDAQERTSYTIVIAPPNSDRVFLHDPAANDSFVEQDISDERMGQVQYFHFGYPPLMRRFYENNAAELTALFKRAKSHGLVTSLDMATIDPEGVAANTDWLVALGNTLPYVDFFLPSIEELCFMLDKEKYAEWQKRAAGQDICELLSLEDDVKPLAQKALSLGCRAVLVKCGIAGLYLCTAPEQTMLDASPHFDGHGWGDLELFQDSFIPKKQILSTVGAGDTSIAAFLYSIMHGFPPEECIAVASATGACCVTCYDTLSGLLPIETLRQHLRDGWERNCVIKP